MSAEERAVQWVARQDVSSGNLKTKLNHLWVIQERNQHCLVWQWPKTINLKACSKDHKMLPQIQCNYRNDSSPSCVTNVFNFLFQQIQSTKTEKNQGSTRKSGKHRNICPYKITERAAKKRFQKRKKVGEQRYGKADAGIRVKEITQVYLVTSVSI